MFTDRDLESQQEGVGDDFSKLFIGGHPLERDHFNYEPLIQFRLMRCDGASLLMGVR